MYMSVRVDQRDTKHLLQITTLLTKVEKNAFWSNRKPREKRIEKPTK
jgi:hypothetical protein